MDFCNPKEFKGGQFNRLDRTTYEDLGRLQINLKKSARKALINQLANSLEKYEDLALGLFKVRKILYQLHREMLVKKISTSQLSNQFNMSIKGQNDQIRKLINYKFRKAYECEKLGKKLEAILHLKQAHINHIFLFRPGIVEIIKLISPLATNELQKIKEIKKQLFFSTIKMTVHIAKKFSAQLGGNMIEWTDLVQEAILASMDAIEKYQPVDNGETFTSFVYTWINGILSKKVSEISRTVSIPRSTLDRYIYIQKAIDSLGLILADLRGGMRGGIRQFNTFGRGKVNYYTLCQIANKATTFLQKNSKPFSPEEVRSLLLATQDEISLDLEIESADGTEESVTLGEIIPDESPPVEEQIDSSLISKRLIRLLSYYTSREELILMKLRYGMGQFHGCKWVADVYCLNTGKPMNKGRVSMVEKQVLNRIRRECEANPTLRRQFLEIIETLPLLIK